MNEPCVCKVFLCICPHHQWGVRPTDGSYNPPFYGWVKEIVNQ